MCLMRLRWYPLHGAEQSSIRRKARRRGTVSFCGEGQRRGSRSLTGRSMVISGGMDAKLVLYPISQ